MVWNNNFSPSSMFTLTKKLCIREREKKGKKEKRKGTKISI